MNVYIISHKNFEIEIEKSWIGREMRTILVPFPTQFQNGDEFLSPNPTRSLIF